MFINLLVEVIETFFHFFSRILFNNFSEFLFVKRKLVAHFLLSYTLCYPSFNTFKQISLFAWIPLISVWFGLGDTAKVVFLSLAALVPVVVNTCDGVRNAPPKLLEVARVYGYSRWQTFAQVVLPVAAPAIFTGVYLALIYSWLATIGAEYLLVAGVGIGNLLIEGSEHFQMDLVIFGMFVVGVIGWLMNALARVAERRLARLRGQDQ